LHRQAKVNKALRHDIQIEGKNFRLRPVTIGDSEFIIQLRSDPRRSRFIHPTSPRISDQHEWLQRYFERGGDFYFLVERAKTFESEGTIAIYDVDETKRCAEWGRWVLIPGSAAAVESAVLIYQVAFSVLNLDMVYCHTVVENSEVVRFHQTYGLTTVATLTNYYDFEGRKCDAFEQQITREQWQLTRAKWEARADWAARLSQKREQPVS
jgi:RimJ/RimL family protein N-acetyltransferase